MSSWTTQMMADKLLLKLPGSSHPYVDELTLSMAQKLRRGERYRSEPVSWVIRSIHNSSKRL